LTFDVAQDTVRRHSSFPTPFIMNDAERTPEESVPAQWSPRSSEPTPSEQRLRAKGRTTKAR